MDSADTLWGQKFHRNHFISHRFRDIIQDGHLKWWETNFWEKLPVESKANLWAKNFNEIALSRTVSEINVFLRFTLVLHWLENNFSEKSPVDTTDILLFRNFNKITLSHTVSKIKAFLCVVQKFKMATKNGGEIIFGKSHQYTLQIPWG